MGESKLDLLQGTLDLMVLQTLAAMGEMHGYGIARRIEQVSGDEVLLNQGTIYAIDEIRFATTAEATTPTPIPIIANCSVFEITPICTLPCVAPSAIRIPISCVRRVTEYEITP
jgi:hypothetical protein